MFVLIISLIYLLSGEIMILKLRIISYLFFVIVFDLIKKSRLKTINWFRIYDKDAEQMKKILKY